MTKHGNQTDTDTVMVRKLIYENIKVEDPIQKETIRDKVLKVVQKRVNEKGQMKS